MRVVVSLLNRRTGVARLSLALGAANGAAALIGFVGFEGAGLSAAEFVILSAQMILCLLQSQALWWLLEAAGTSRLRRRPLSWGLAVTSSRQRSRPH